MNVSDPLPPERDDSDDLEFLDDQQKSLISLIAAITWISTRNAEDTLAIAQNEWIFTFESSSLMTKSDALEAWKQLQTSIIENKISAFGICYVIPERFDQSVDSWAARGGKVIQIKSSRFRNLEPVLHRRASYFALRPPGLISAGAKWFRDVQVEQDQLQLIFPPATAVEPKLKKRRARSASKLTAAMSVYKELFGSLEVRSAMNQDQRLEKLNGALKTRVINTIGLTTFKTIEKKLR